LEEDDDVKRDSSSITNEGMTVEGKTDGSTTSEMPIGLRPVKHRIKANEGRK
jgi:hypothetical protein